MPCYNNDYTVSHVVKTVGKGLSTYFSDSKVIIMVEDRGSTDDSWEETLTLYR